MSARPPLWLRALGRLVPASERTDWLDEWSGELAALRREGAGGLRRLRFAWGALPHASSLGLAGATSGGWRSDIRLALRAQIRHPAFSAIAAATLALGIAANAALFSLVDGLLLRAPAAIADPSTLVQLGRSYDDAPRWDNFAYPVVDQLREADHLFEGVAAYAGRTFLLGEGTAAEIVAGAYVTGDYFEVLGVAPFAGRLLQPADDVDGGPDVVVVSHALWQRRWAAESTVIGGTVRIGGRPHEIVGVAPPGFAGVDKLSAAPEVFVPTATRASPPGVQSSPRTTWGMSWLWAVARTRPGLELEELRAGLAGVSSRLQAASNDNDGIRVLAEPGVGLSPQERTEAQTLAGLMWVVSGLVLLLTCANVAGLVVARTVDRRSEFALRRTLGAGGGRIARQLLIESLALAGLATIIAVPLLELGATHVARLIPSAVSIEFEPGLGVYGALVGLGLLAGLVFGGGPALAMAREAPARGLGARTTTSGRGAKRWRAALVVAQVAVSLGLLSGAGVLLRSVAAATSARPGLDPAGLLAVSLDLGLTGRYDDHATRQAFVDQLVASLEDHPAISSAAASSAAPFLGPFGRRSQRPRDGDPEQRFEADIMYVAPDWFELVGIPLRAGRLFEADGEAEPVAVIDERLAERFWPGVDPLGQYLDTEPATRVVGVTAAARTRSLRRAPAPTVFMPLAEADGWPTVIQTRAAPGADRASAVDAMRATIGRLDPGLPVTGVHDLQDRMTATLGETRNLGTLIAGMSGLALLLATLGLYASLSYRVARGTRDLAVRIAVGARPDAVFRSVVRRGLALVTAGIAIGVGIAWGLGTALRGTLYAVEPFDPATLTVVVLAQGAIALLATAVPARRATRVDPSRALRNES